MGDYDGVIGILDAEGQLVGNGRATLMHQASDANPLRWSGRLDIPSTPALLQWLKRTRHEIRFRTTDGRAGTGISYRFPGTLPASIDVFGTKDAPFD